MNSTLAPSPWPAPARAETAAGWRIGREWPAPADSSELPGVRWHMVRNASYMPGCLLAVFVALAVVTLAIGVAFWQLGAPAVLPLAGLELLLVGAAFGWCSRHAGDDETITLSRRELRVEHRCGRAVDSAAFRAEWVRVEPAHGEGSLVEISGQGQRLRVGRYLRPELRTTLARELRRALRLESTRPPAQDKQLEPQR